MSFKMDTIALYQSVIPKLYDITISYSSYFTISSSNDRMTESEPYLPRLVFRVASLPENDPGSDKSLFSGRVPTGGGGALSGGGGYCLPPDTRPP